MPLTSMEAAYYRKRKLWWNLVFLGVLKRMKARKAPSNLERFFCSVYVHETPSRMGMAHVDCFPGFRVDSWPLFKDSTPQTWTFLRSFFGPRNIGTQITASMLVAWQNSLANLYWSRMVQNFLDSRIEKMGVFGIPGDIPSILTWMTWEVMTLKGLFFFGILRSLPWVTLHFALCQWQCLGMSWWRKTRSGVE